MIYINEENQEEIPLKQEFHFSHNFCLVLYDLMGEFLKKDAFVELRNHKFEVQNDQGYKNMEELRSGKIHVIEWLKENDLTDELVTIITKNIVSALIADFSNFIYEALRCAMHGKTTVAYALMRKPLTDILFLFEMILEDKKGFIEKFYLNGDPDNYDPSNKKFDEAYKKDLIAHAKSKIINSAGIDENLIYQLRYDKSMLQGFNPITNQALHIVTRDKHYKTEKQNLNFVFQGPKGVEDHWEHIYFFIPYLLNYTVGVVENIVYDLIDVQDEVKEMRTLKVFSGLLLWMKQGKISEKINFDNIKTPMKCDSCGKVNDVDMVDFELYYKTDLLICRYCSESLLNYPDNYRPEIFDSDWADENMPDK